MNKPPGWVGRKGLFFQKKQFLLFGLLFFALLFSLITFLFTWGGKEEMKSKLISPEVLSKIHQERAKAQKEHAEFIKTPAGKIWERHPYWDRPACQKIAEGQVFLGMNKEMAREAISSPVEVKIEKHGDTLYEEWTVGGKDKMILKFEGNVLISIQQR